MVMTFLYYMHQYSFYQVSWSRMRATRIRVPLLSEDCWRQTTVSTKAWNIFLASGLLLVKQGKPYFYSGWRNSTLYKQCFSVVGTKFFLMCMYLMNGQGTNSDTLWFFYGGLHVKNRLEQPLKARYTS